MKHVKKIMDLFKMPILSFIAGFFVYAIIDSSYWGVFSGVLVFTFHWLYESKIFLDFDSNPKNHSFFKTEHYRSLLFALFLLAISSLITGLIMEYIIEK